MAGEDRDWWQAIVREALDHLDRIEKLEGQLNATTEALRSVLADPHPFGLGFAEDGE